MANKNVYCQFEPCSPPVVQGIEFVCIDPVRRIWMGTGPAATMETMDSGAFMSEALLARFAMDAAALTAAKTAWDAASADAADAADTLASAQSTLNLAKVALLDANADLGSAQADLATDPEDEDLVQAEEDAQGAVDAAVLALGEAQTAFDEALATAITATAAESVARVKHADLFEIAHLSREGSFNPYTNALP